jgi:hypothetical protein
MSCLYHREKNWKKEEGWCLVVYCNMLILKNLKPVIVRILEYRDEWECGQVYNCKAHRCNQDKGTKPEESSEEAR